MGGKIKIDRFLNQEMIWFYKDNGVMKGECTIRYLTHEDQIKAIHAFDNQYFLGNKIKVEASIVKHRMVLHGQQLRKKEERIIEEPLPRDPKQCLLGNMSITTLISTPKSFLALILTKIMFKMFQGYVDFLMVKLCVRVM